MKLITLFIGKRLDHIIDFSIPHIDRANDNPTSFIIQSEQEKTELLSLYHKVGNNVFKFKHESPRNNDMPDEAKSIIYQTESGEKYLYISKIELVENSVSVNEVQDDAFTVDNTAVQKTNEIVEACEDLSDETKIDSIVEGETTKEDLKEIQQPISAEKEKELEIKFDLTEDRNTKLISDDLNDERFSFDTDNSLYHLYLNKKQEKPLRIKLTFILRESNNETTSRAILLYVAKREHINDVVLDFGSEASQLSIFKRDRDQTINNVCKLFSLMSNLCEDTSQKEKDGERSNKDSSAQIIQKDSSSDQKEKDGERSNKDSSAKIIQKDSSSDYFYKSVFFTKRTFTDKEAGEPIAKINGNKKLDGSNDMLKIYTSVKETQELLRNNNYIQIPNVKLVHFGGLRLPTVKLNEMEIPISEYKDGNNYFYRACINRFLICALKNCYRPCVCFYVLMPNVYSPIDVYEHLSWMREDINNMIKTNKELRRIKCVELAAVSESDASLMGAIHLIESNDKRIESGKYLILDAGKGTLDFSILNYDGQKYTSLYRSGIIGAGNALTYAYLFALLTDFAKASLHSITNLKQNDYRTFINDKILGGDMAYTKELMDAVEMYKMAIGKNWTIQKKINDDKVDKAEKLEELKVSTFIDFIQKFYDGRNETYTPLSNEAQKFIDGTIDQIVNEVCQRLSYWDNPNKDRASNENSKRNTNTVYDETLTKGVVFAGRGFRLPAFKRKMLQRLIKEKKIEHKKEMSFMGDNINVDEKIICLFIRDFIRKGRYDNYMLCRPFVLGQSSRETYFWKKQSFFSKWGEWFNNKWGDWKRKLNLSNNPTIKNNYGSSPLIFSREQLTPENVTIPGNTSDNGAVTGYEIDTGGDFYRLLIGGSRFETSLKGKNLRFFFSEGKMYLRNDNNNGFEEIDDTRINLSTSPFVFGTMFPNVQPGSNEEIKIPPVPKSETSQPDGQDSNDKRTESPSKSSADEAVNLTNKF